MTRNVAEVFDVLLEDPQTRLWGYEIAALTGLGTGSVYAILGRYEHIGWLEGNFEDAGSAAAEARPPRRLYCVTSQGAREAPAAMARFREKRRPRARILRGTTESA